MNKPNERERSHPAPLPVVPARSADDQDHGWGESAPDDRDEDLLRERPPHWQ